MFEDGHANHTDPTGDGSGSNIPQFWGFIAAAISILFFGTNFVPVKKFDTGDGKPFFISCTILRRFEAYCLTAVSLFIQNTHF